MVAMDIQVGMRVKLRWKATIHRLIPEHESDGFASRLSFEDHNADLERHNERSSEFQALVDGRFGHVVARNDRDIVVWLDSGRIVRLGADHVAWQTSTTVDYHHDPDGVGVVVEP